jgi:hypothetical protein
MSRYYDLVLGLIPLALLGIGGTLVAAGLQVTTAVFVGAAAAAALIGHAMFVRTPRDDHVARLDRTHADGSGVDRSPVDGSLVDGAPADAEAPPAVESLD